MSQSEPQGPREPPFTAAAIETAYKCILPISALLYGIGLVIENIRAQSYGWMGSQLFQAQYALTGLLWGSLTSFGLVAARAVRDLFRERKLVWPGDGIRNQLARYSLVLAGIAGFWIFYFIMAGFLGVLDLYVKLAALVVILFNSWSVSALFLDTWSDMMRWSKPEDSFIAKLWKTDSIQIAKRSLYCVVALSLYATMVYPQISPALGGGKLRQAEIVLRKEQRSLFDAFPAFKIDSDGKISSVVIVGESNEFLFIGLVDQRWWRPPETSVRLRKDAIQLISYANK